MIVFQVSKEEAIMLLSIMEETRTKKDFIEWILGDGTEYKVEREYEFPFREYGNPNAFYLVVNNNTMVFYMMFERYRVSYALRASNLWKTVEVASLGGTYFVMNLESDRRLSGSAAIVLVTYMKQFKEGADNLYRILGSNMKKNNFLEKLLVDF